MVVFLLIISLAVGIFCGLATLGTVELRAPIVETIVYAIVAVGCLSLGVGGLVSHYRHKRELIDTDGDGIGGDGLPASDEQKVLITLYFQELGKFYTPSRKLTRGEAREVLRDLEARVGKTPDEINQGKA